MEKPAQVGTLKWLLEAARAIELGELRLPAVAPTGNAVKVVTLERGHVDELWRRMVAAYGHKWVSNFGDVDEDDTWLLGLQGIRPDQLGHGFMAALRNYKDWPPNLPQFRALCEIPVTGPQPGLSPIRDKVTPEFKQKWDEHMKEWRKIIADAAAPMPQRTPGEDDDK